MSLELTTVPCRGNTFSISSVWTAGSRLAHPQDHLQGTPREGAGAVLGDDSLPLLGLHRRVDQRRGVRREHFARVAARVLLRSDTSGKPGRKCESQ